MLRKVSATSWRSANQQVIGIEAGVAPRGAGAWCPSGSGNLQPHPNVVDPAMYRQWERSCRPPRAEELAKRDRQPALMDPTDTQVRDRGCWIPPTVRERGRLGDKAADGSDFPGSRAVMRLGALPGRLGSRYSRHERPTTPVGG